MQVFPTTEVPVGHVQVDPKRVAPMAQPHLLAEVTLALVGPKYSLISTGWPTVISPSMLRSILPVSWEQYAGGALATAGSKSPLQKFSQGLMRTFNSIGNPAAAAGCSRTSWFIVASLLPSDFASNLFEGSRNESAG